MHFINSKRYILLLLSLHLLFSAHAQAVNHSSHTTQSQTSSFETHFFSKLHQGNQQEMEIGRLAQQEGDSQQVRDFGAQLIKDHSEADRKIMNLAQTKNWNISNSPKPRNSNEKEESDKKNKELTKLKSLSGVEFDNEFKKLMIKSHQQNISEVQRAIPKLSDSDARDLAQSLLPTLKHHEEMAKNLPKETSPTMTG